MFVVLFVRAPLFLQAFSRQTDIKYFSPLSLPQLQAIRAQSFPHMTAAQCEKRYLKYGGSICLVLTLSGASTKNRKLALQELSRTEKGDDTILRERINSMTVEELKQCCKQENAQGVSRFKGLHCSHLILSIYPKLAQPADCLSSSVLSLDTLQDRKVNCCLARHRALCM